LHHIERLMVVGNAMFLCEIQPTEVYRWFMEMFADSYDWVMLGNVFYMSQWGSDAMTTKPYISSSAYLLRMSDYKRGPWADDWDALYWGSIASHAALIRKNYRMAAQVSFWEKKSASDKAAVRRRVSDVLGRL
jgi:deoxyribodipyrimidine photolyase-related protein